ncbi:MAG: SGNH/GDSL hydrolase family protein [Deltaproteobacteria bacterium]|nr:SGNH/GDSL hydrolase family protein [Deltaproteobacteria bacterium]MBW2398140.1 SGNH/GDSL hydrolase family protein [Deltaproteobacteria bacterium]MBW2665176.1 SGNH/GDSL hydrolase family protein [Deltaproteobacteria bacterium]
MRESSSGRDSDGRSIRRWAPRFLLLLCSSVVALALAEGWARLTYRPVLEMSGEFLGVEAYPEQRNHDGFREGDLEVEVMAAGMQRVLFLGDSFTFGSGVDDPALRFSDRLERAFGDGFHFYNAGIPGSQPSDWVRFVGVFLRDYRPDAVVAVFFLRDGTALGTALHYHVDRIAEIRAEHCGRPVERHSYLVKRICDIRVQRDFTEWYLGEFRRAYLGSEQERRVWVEMQAELLAIRKSSVEAGASFHLVVFPLLYGLKDYEFHDVEAEILRFAETHDIPAMSLISGFEGKDERDLWVSPVDQHPNAVGHEIAAETLLPYLTEILK